MAENLSEIDFDQLTTWLGQLDGLLGQVGSRQTESDVLRSDLIGRLSGMVKAIAAVSDSRQDLSGSLLYLDGLKTMTADDLIEQYRRVSARFRDSFPSSFGQPIPLSGSRGTVSDPAEFK